MPSPALVATATAPLSTKPPAPAYLQYAQPPIVIDGAAIGAADAHGFRVRFKTFDYGVISVALTRPLPETWPATARGRHRLARQRHAVADAEALCRSSSSASAPAISRGGTGFLNEDYLVFTIHPDGSARTRRRGARTGRDRAVAAGERTAERAGTRERARSRISYYTTDVVIPTWSSALVYDTEEGARGALEILEFANSQLLEFRYYDQLLDAELAQDLRELQRAGGVRTLLGAGTSGPPGRCTRSSSTSTNWRTRPRTRSRSPAMSTPRACSAWPPRGSGSIGGRRTSTRS